MTTTPPSEFRARSARCVAVVVTLVAVFVLSPLGATPAQASCGIKQGWKGESVPQNDTHFGTKSGSLDVTNYSVDCPTFRTNYVRLDPNNWVEVGWYENPSSYLSGDCDTYSTPHLYVFAVVDGSVAKCQKSPPALDGNPHAFYVKNPAHDYTWEYYLDGDFEGSYSTDMTLGAVYAGSERHGSGETLRASFSQLKWFGASGNWQAYDDTHREKVGGFTDFDFCPTGTAGFDVKPNC